MMTLVVAALSAIQEVPAPVTTLTALRKAVLKDEARGAAGSRVWGLTRSSWSAVWGQRAFGIGSVEAVDTSGFGFRVPPDSKLERYGGGSPFLVEAYQDGFPTWGVRRNGDVELCRPLGFVYKPDGLCGNASVFEFGPGGWKKLPLTRRTTTLLARRLNYFAPAKLSDLTTPWFRIVAEGYGTYCVDRDLNCVGPFGVSCRLDPDGREAIGEMLAGKWEPQAGR